MDGWGLPVPEEVRGVLREIGGVTVPGLPALRLLPGASEHAVDPETHRMLGGDGTYWPLARVEYGRSSALAQVRIDPASGRWGYAVSVPTDPKGLREHPEVTLLAESLADLLLSFARRARRTTQRPDFAGRVPDMRRLALPQHRPALAPSHPGRRMARLVRSAARGGHRTAAGDPRGRPAQGPDPERPVLLPGTGLAVRGPAGPPALRGGW